MPFGPSVRSNLECTTAPTATEVGVNGAGAVSGVATAAASSPSAVPAGGVVRSCGTTHNLPRATLQRMGSSRGCLDGATTAPRGYNTSAPATPTAADSAKGAPHISPAPQPSSPSCVHAPGARHASEGKTSAGTLPALTLATPPCASSAPNDIGASVSTTTSSPSSTVALPRVCPRRTSNTSMELTEDEGGYSNKPTSRWASLGRPNGTSSPTVTRRAVAQLPSLSTTDSGQRPPVGEDVATVAGTSSSHRVEAASSCSVSPSHREHESYFRENNIPSLFNELSEALLDAQPEDPVLFMKEWLKRRRDTIAL
ncbi:hypothetical protein GH5_00809 [Leishmania sp. Ghana 2012 LV757]|uniref:hypothetical protein n=1 Tax=Leishmania sp. Ghana 2012 LV757 TaxID=2803181 RepID=UPI001B4FF5B9|nr:hypothetical protein GH5_00809 [Leishmania sp. Ghana 2012 LV757]